MGKLAAAAIAALVLVIVLIAAAGAGVASFLGLGDAGGNSTLCGTGSAAAGTDLGDGEKLTATQIANAHTIYQVGVQMGIPVYGEQIAIATAIQESRLQNLDYGDRDSLGLFQQRPSQGWGTPAELTDPVYASTKFYQALDDVANWQNLALAVAAQDVQRSAYPDAYAQWQNVAGQLVATFAGTTGPCPSTNAATAIPPGYSIPPGTPPQVVTAIDYALAQLGKPYIYGGTGPTGYDCSGLVMEAYLAAGIQLPRTSEQQALVGTSVDTDALKPGDLLFAAGSDGTPQAPGHVGMYLGDGYVIEAPHTGTTVSIDSWDSAWKPQTVAIRRLID
ncbi:C40 family peptidase [Actinospica robiniae]|uniref:C40 family peptidase n=1 Tax=Actinospica robiniae TaxID=304901 RepID=UPI00041200B9|nr:C40 family peptidase [Actinospica robiniae]